MVADQPKLYGWGMCKFEVDEDHSEHVVMSVDQIDRRFMFVADLGDYIYPTAKIILT